jgi:histidine triad (HIT) family protein
MDCIFCKIAAGALPVTLLYQDEQVVVFRDIAPQAPTHFLVVPREHLPSLAQAAPGHVPLFGHMLAVAANVARSEGLSEGFRTVINTGPDGGQTVDHLHIHVLGGRAMTWPPG